jgi:ribosomal protein S27AE
LTVPETLPKLDKWVEESIKHSKGLIQVFIVLGNKKDLEDQRAVKKKNVDKFLKHLKEEKGIEAHYMETSALTGENIQDAFELMGRVFLEDEGFPRKGFGGDVDDELLTKHQHQYQEVITAPNPQTQADLQTLEEAVQDIDTTSLEPIKNLFQGILSRIDSLTQVTTAIEERLILLETREGRQEELSRKLMNLQEAIVDVGLKVDNLSDLSTEIESETLVTTSDSSSSVDNSDITTVAVPTMADLSPESDDPSEEKKEQSSESTSGSIEILEFEDGEVVEDEDNESFSSEDAEFEEESPDLPDVPSDLKSSDVAEFEDDQESDDQEESSQARCPKCGSKLSFIRQYQRWYCYRCKNYV